MDNFSTGQRNTALKVKFENLLITSYSTGGSSEAPPTEEVAFYYNKIAF